jgi:hypothetical protein
MDLAQRGIHLIDPAPQKNAADATRKNLSFPYNPQKQKQLAKTSRNKVTEQSTAKQTNKKLRNFHYLPPKKPYKTKANHKPSIKPNKT